MIFRNSLFFVVAVLLLTACGSRDVNVVDARGEPADVLLSDVTDAAGSPDVAAPDGHGELVGDVSPEQTVLDFVDPMIGTGGLSYRLGNVFIGATLPFGMAKVGPDTKHDPWGEPGFTHCEG